MKKFLIVVLLFLTGISEAQDVVNMLPCDDYEAITINGKTIEQLNATNA